MASGNEIQKQPNKKLQTNYQQDKQTARTNMTLFHPYTLENIHPGFSIDCVVLSYYKKKIRVLLNRFDISPYWQLPGGFMFREEDSDQAVKRVLKERTGVENIFLRQFHLFSDPQRTKLEQNLDYINKTIKKGENTKDVDKWFMQRFISLGYYALAKYDEIKLVSTKKDTAKWFDINNLPDLYSDHEHIINKSLEMIRSTLPVLPIGYELLPEKFTMSDLRKIYETFLDKTLDRRNFQRKILAADILDQLDETANESPYNPPILYSFKKKHTDQNNITF